MGWIRSGGPQALQTLKELKQRPARRDYGPPLQWEREVWQWFERLAHAAFEGATLRVDRLGWLALCQREGWDEDLAFSLLAEIEHGFAVEKPEVSP